MLSTCGGVGENAQKDGFEGRSGPHVAGRDESEDIGRCCFVASGKLAVCTREKKNERERVREFRKEGYQLRHLMDYSNYHDEHKLKPRFSERLYQTWRWA